MSKQELLGNPWMDFASYGINDASRFKGREEEIKKFLGIIDSGTMSVLYANSGIGKTSFLNAGISPIYQGKGYFPIHIVFPDEVFANKDIESWLLFRIKEAFVRQDGNNEDSDRFVWNTTIENEIEECKNSLWWHLHTKVMLDCDTGKTYYPLLVFDQFEEVFRKSKKYANVDIVQILFKLVGQLASTSLPIEIERELEKQEANGNYVEVENDHHYKVVFSLRKEYLSDFDYWTNDVNSISELLQNRMFLLPLKREQAVKVITQQPIDDEGTECYTTLNKVTDKILDLIDPRGKDEIEPFMLSALCSKLYGKAVSENKKQLDVNDVDANITNIVLEIYEEKVHSIFHDAGHLKRFEEVLVDEDGHRNRPKIKVLDDIQFKLLYQKKLEDAHLIRIDVYDEDVYIELIHDLLANAISKKRENIEQTRRIEELQEQKARMNRHTRIFLITLGILAFLVIIGWLVCLGVKSRIPFDPSDVKPGEVVPVHGRLYTVSDGKLILRNCGVGPYTFIYNPEVHTLELDSVKFSYNSFNLPNLDTLVIGSGQYFPGYNDKVADSVSVIVAKRPIGGIGRVFWVKHVDTVLIASEDTSFVKWYNGVLLARANKEDKWTVVLCCEKKNNDYYTDTIFFGTDIPNPFFAVVDYDVANPPQIERILSTYNDRVLWRLICTDSNRTILRSSDIPQKGDIAFVDMPYIKRIENGTFLYNSWRNRRVYVYEVDFPQLEEVKDSSFWWQEKLRRINMPKVRNIGKYAFSHCNKLNIVVLDSLRRLNNYAFYGCDSVRTLSLPVVDTIGEGALPGFRDGYEWSWNPNVRKHRLCYDYSSPKNQLQVIEKFTEKPVTQNECEEKKGYNVCPNGYKITKTVYDSNGNFVGLEYDSSSPCYRIVITSDTIPSLTITEGVNEIDLTKVFATGLVIDTISVVGHNEYFSLYHGMLFNFGGKMEYGLDNFTGIWHWTALAEPKERIVIPPSKYNYKYVNVSNKSRLRECVAVCGRDYLDCFKSPNVTLYVPYGQRDSYDSKGWYNVKELSVVQTIYYQTLYWLPLKMRTLQKSTDVSDILAFVTCGLFMFFLMMVAHWMKWRRLNRWWRWILDISVMAIILIIAGNMAYSCDVTYGESGKSISMWPIWWFAPAMWIIYIFLTEKYNRRKKQLNNT